MPARTLGVSAAMAVAALVTPSAQAPLPVREAVARYAAGELTVVPRVARQSVMVAGFLTDLDAWIMDAPADAMPRRRVVAATFALDVTWAATRGIFNERRGPADSWGRVTPNDPARWSITRDFAQPLVAQWVASQIPRTKAPSLVERTMWLATIGLAQDAHAWHHLTNDVLPAARARLGDEPRVRLAEVLARTGRDLGPLRRNWGPTFVPGLRREALSSGVARRIPDAVRAFDAIRSDARLSAEVDLHIGYLELRRDRWADALARLTAARDAADEPWLRAAADYFSGWIHEHAERPAEAIAAYRRANAILPEMRGVATRLSALLFLHNERADAFQILDRALNARPAPRDVLIALERGDARFVPEWLDTLREAVR